jgi:hypothetical protein
MLYYQEYKFYKSTLHQQKIIVSVVLEELKTQEIDEMIYEFNHKLDLEKQEEVISTIKKVFGDLYKKLQEEAIKAITIKASQLN